MLKKGGRPAVELGAKTMARAIGRWTPVRVSPRRPSSLDGQRQGPADYLAQAVHLEVTGRRELRIQDARFPMLKTLGAFSFEAQSDIDRDAVLHVFDCRFIADAATVVFGAVSPAARGAWMLKHDSQ